MVSERFLEFKIIFDFFFGTCSRLKIDYKYRLQIID
jgi:hypothetical protein